MSGFEGFDPEQALACARELSYPRLAGSEGERRAAAQIEARLQAAGWQVQRLPFAFSTRAEGFLKAGLLCGLLLAAALNLVPPQAGLGPALRLLLSALLLLLLFGLPRGYARQRRRQVQALEGGARPRPGLPGRAENLFARLPGSEGADQPLLILMAHYDSKSQNLPLRLRVACFSLASLGALASALLAPLGLLWPALLPLAQGAGLAAVLAGLPLLTLRVGNASPGASDNASGAGLVLHLAEALARRPELRGGVNVACLFTSAEELGLLGALAFIQARGGELRLQAQGAGLQVLNFDGVGVEGRLHLMGSPGGGRLERALQTGGRPLRRFRLPGALYDHLPFARLGLEAETLAAIGPAGAAVHTPADGPHLLHPEGFRRAGEAALAAVAALSARS